jgi:hypothetical protein
MLVAASARALFHACPPSGARTEQKDCDRAISMPTSRRVAVYIYNFGGYDDFRRRHIPDAKSKWGGDAYFFVDQASAHRNAVTLMLWKTNGWKVKKVELLAATPFITSERLTTKFYKWGAQTTYKHLRQQGYNWVITFDSNMYINLRSLSHFLLRFEDKAVVHVDWRHW